MYSWKYRRRASEIPDTILIYRKSRKVVSGGGQRGSFLCSPSRKRSRRLSLVELESGDRDIGDRCEPQKSGPRQARATTAYNGIDEAIILRANEHYCQRDVDKNGRANHEIPRAVSGLSLSLALFLADPRRLESGKNRYRPADRSTSGTDR